MKLFLIFSSLTGGSLKKDIDSFMRVFNSSEVLIFLSLNPSILFIKTSILFLLSSATYSNKFKLSSISLTPTSLRESLWSKCVNKHVEHKNALSKVQ